MKKSPWLLASCLALTPASLAAQDAKVPAEVPAEVPAQKPAQKPARAKPAELDTIAKQTLETWAKKLHHPGRAGVRKVEFTIAVTSRGGMTGKWKAAGTYRYDAGDAKHPWGRLSWDDKEVAAAMERRGFTAEAFGRDFQTDPTLGFAGAKITGAKKKNGTILTVRGGDRKEDTFLLFDKAGVHVGTMIGPMRKKLYYERWNKQLVRSGETYSIPKSSGALTMPETKGDLTRWYRDIRGHHVPVKLHELVRVNGKLMSDLTLSFRKYVIQPKTTKRRPTSKPAKREAGKKKIGKE